MSLPFTKKERIPCRHHLQGKCNKGKACPFAHVDRKEEARNSAMATVLKLVMEKQNSVIVANNGDLLNLANLASCPDLEKLAGNIDFDSMAFCEALVSCVAQCCPMIQFICIDNNNIRSLFHFLKALERFELHVGIRGLSAQSNQVNTLEFIKQLKAFPNLMELNLVGNPITEKDEYRPAVRKGLPGLEGLDGAGVNRPPLNLPWPAHVDYSAPGPQHDEESAAIANGIVANLIRKSERSNGGGVDAISALYCPDAVFSLVCSSDAALKAPTISAEVARRNVILRDFIAVRMAQTDRDNNLKTVRTVRTAKGRTDVCSALRAAVYPKALDVSHQLSSDVDVSFIDGKHERLVFVHLHGQITWRHSETVMELDTPQVTRYFDRSLTLRSSQEHFSGFLITNDALTIRLDEGGATGPLWFADAEPRLQALADKHGIHPGVLKAIVPQCSNDVEFHSRVEEMAQLQAEQLAHCLEAAGGDADLAVKVARVVVSCRVTPDAAVIALSQHEYDADAVLANGGLQPSW